MSAMNFEKFHCEWSCSSVPLKVEVFRIDVALMISCQSNFGTEAWVLFSVVLFYLGIFL